MATTTSNLIGTAEAAQTLNVDRSTLTRMVQSGKLKPALRGEGLRGAMFFRRADVDRVSRGAA